MKRLVLASAAMALAAIAATTTDNPFQTRLSADRRIVHVLNRLTFGPRPGDVDEVRKAGVEKWIDLQLHPDRISENPALDAKLKPLETLRMEPAQIIKDYSPMRVAPPFTPLTELLPGDQFRKVMNGTAEQRQKAIAALDPEKRSKVLAMLQPDTLEGLPELQKEAEAARKAQNEQRQKEFRSRMPQLNDLLNPDQMQMAYRGNTEQLTELFAYFEPARRIQIAGALPPNSLSAFPELRREAMKQRQPQQAVIGDLREGKIYRALYSNRQLEEVLVDFWFNHFNVYEGKNNVNLRPLMASYERDAIRPHVLGHFKDLLLATARHPAMLYYLDNWESVLKDAFEIGRLRQTSNRWRVNWPGRRTA